MSASTPGSPITLTGTLHDAAGAAYPTTMTIEPPSPPPQPGAPSKDGTKVSNTTDVIVTDDGTQWRMQPGATAAQGNVIQFAPKGTTTWAPAGNTALVTLIEKWKATCAQTSPNASSYGAPGWWSGVMADATTFGGWSEIPGDPSAPAPKPPQPPAGAWSVSGGKILRSGAPVTIFGPAILDKMMGNYPPLRLKNWFPTMNAINLAAGADGNGYATAQPMSSLFGYIDAALAQKLMVLISDYAPGQPAVRSGADLDASCNWIGAIARNYANAPDVIFTTENEASGNLTPSHRRIYQAIRGAGNGSLIFMESQDGNATTTAGLDAGGYADMTNVGWNVHFYPWEYNRASGNQADYDNTSRSFVSRFQNFARSADGIMPVLMGEGGNSTAGSGTSPDDPIIAGRYAVTQSILNTAGKPGGTCGAFPWLMSWFGQVSPGSGDADTMEINGNLTAYGRQVAVGIPA